jgi:hypothetical protein
LKAHWEVIMESLRFKFKWLDGQGNEAGFLSKKGSFDGQTLVLDDVQLPGSCLTTVENRGKRFVVAAVNVEGQTHQALFSITSGSPEKLKAALSLCRSRTWAEAHREALVEQGQAQKFRSAICPHCQATIDLTGMPPSPQVYCPFCHTLGTMDAPEGPIKAEAQYRLCDECGMYSKPRKFTIFYFYFLLVFYGFYQQETWRCPACMRPEAWKMLFGNLLFVIGVPVALVQLFRSYGGTDIGSLFAGLDSANLKARQGNLAGAIEGYRRILTEHPAAAGIKYNIGLAALSKNDWAGAAEIFEHALHDCANYQPAAAALAGCYERLGKTEKLNELQKQWGFEEEQSPQSS